MTNQSRTAHKAVTPGLAFRDEADSTHETGQPAVPDVTECQTGQPVPDESDVTETRDRYA